jgi:hypothetical protein
MINDMIVDEQVLAQGLETRVDKKSVQPVLKPTINWSLIQ